MRLGACLCLGSWCDAMCRTNARFNFACAHQAEVLPYGKAPAASCVLMGSLMV
jgi:hypothetical protein